MLDNSLRGVQSHIDSVRDRENEVGLDLPDFADNDEPDVNNSTHTIQVDMEEQPNLQAIKRSGQVSNASPEPNHLQDNDKEEDSLHGDKHLGEASNVASD